MRSGLPYDRPRIPEKLNGHHGHRYFSTEEARRQHKINSFMRSALSRMKRLPLAMCWSKWAAEIKVRSKCMQRCALCCEGPRCRCAERAAIRRQRKKRVAHLGAKALGRFKNLLLAKCFQPWSGMARREVLEKHVRRPPLFGRKLRLRDACHVVCDVREKLRDALIYQANG